MNPTVFIVDDDQAVRYALSALIKAAGLQVRTFASAEEFLDAYDSAHPACLLLDIHLTGMTGLELQAELAARGIRLPIIFITGSGDIPGAVRALKAGAVDFLEKPVEGKTLIAHVQSALELDARHYLATRDKEAVLARCKLLTAREREVMKLVVTGLSSKVIAQRLGISHRTVEIHRTRVMQKMSVASLAELLHLAAACGLLPAPDAQATSEAKAC